MNKVLKRYWHLLVLLAWIGYAVQGVAPSKQSDGFDLDAAGRIPVMHQGRVKPLDTVARSTLLMLSGKQQVRLESGDKQPAIEWLLDVACHSDEAGEPKVITIHDPDIKGLIDAAPDQKHFSAQALMPLREHILIQAQAAAELESPNRNAYQKAVLRLHEQLLAYRRLQNAFAPAGTHDFHEEVRQYHDLLQHAADAEERPDEALIQLASLYERYQRFAELTDVLSVYPADGADWSTAGDSLLNTLDQSGKLHPATLFFADLRDAYRQGDTTRFNQLVQTYRTSLPPSAVGMSNIEAAFNRAGPFTRAMTIYLVGFLLACASWMKWPNILSTAALTTTFAAMLVHSTGLVLRMAIEGRPPVTNLYSSAVFVGFGAVILGLVLERFYRSGIGSASAAVIGFATLIVAHHLSLGGDTMEPMRAVLDSNFWLATHVVIITLGYAGTFVAGLLAAIYLIRERLGNLSRSDSRALNTMVYGVICFSLLFSFVGTILGGIWADQSWGRFWGWDPKENGALLIVIWNAVILHARWGGLAKARGIMQMAVFGNNITAFSWFGVNMMGVGLHAYGFMHKAMIWLIGFMGLNLVILALGWWPRLALARSKTKSTTAPAPVLCQE